MCIKEKQHLHEELAQERERLSKELAEEKAGPSIGFRV